MTARNPPSPSPDDDGTTLKQLERLWCESLRVERVPHDVSFFALGGSSMLVIRMLAAVSSRCGCELDLDAFFADPTLGTLHRLLRLHPST